MVGSGNGLVSPRATEPPLASTTTAAGPLFAGTGDVYREIASVHVCAVHGAHGFLRFLIGAHGYESESAGPAAGAVHHEVGLEHGAVCGEGVLQIIFGCVEGKISNKQFIIHS